MREELVGFFLNGKNGMDGEKFLLHFMICLVGRFGVYQINA